MSRLYLDASSIIYMTQGHELFGAPTQRRILQHLERPTARVLTSRLARLECRMAPLRDRNHELLAEYERFFASERLELADITAETIERATDLRARYKFKTPDTLHLATALEHGAEAVLTGDPAWRRCLELAVEVVDADQ